jgi:hypothetical protein
MVDLSESAGERAAGVTCLRRDQFSRLPERRKMTTKPRGRLAVWRNHGGQAAAGRRSLFCLSQVNAQCRPGSRKGRVPCPRKTTHQKNLVGLHRSLTAQVASVRLRHRFPCSVPIVGVC